MGNENIMHQNLVSGFKSFIFHKTIPRLCNVFILKKLNGLKSFKVYFSHYNEFAY
jgi:hypothetical protein